MKKGICISSKSKGSTREALTREYSKELRAQLARFDMDGIRVSDVIERREISGHENKLTCGLLGTHEDITAIFVSSVGVSYSGNPIEVLLIPPTLECSLMVDEENNQVAANFFYEFKEGEIRPVEVCKPLVLDGLNITYTGTEGYEGPLDVLINGPELLALTDDKLRTKEVFHETDLRMPASCILENEDFDNLHEAIQNFLTEVGCRGFAIKGNFSSGGSHVKLFGNQEIESAVDFVIKLSKAGKTVFIEERINPLDWKNGGKDVLDWNIRALVTLVDKPEWIDAEVRYNVRSELPVNVCKGAKVDQLETVAEKTGASLEKIKHYSIAAAKVIFEKMRSIGAHSAGFLGLDLMVDEQGVSGIEVNSGAVGGFASLLKLRKGPLHSVAVLLNSLGPFLEENHRKRIDVSGYNSLPNTWMGYNYMGRIFCEAKMYNEALELFKEAIRLDPEIAIAHYNEGVALQYLNRPEEAVESFKEAIKLDPEYANAHCHEGISLQNLNRWKESVESFKEAIKLDPEYANAFCGYGATLGKLGRLEEAVELFKEAIRLDPENANAHIGYGFALSNQEKLREAAELFKEAIRLDPENANAFFYYGVSLGKLGRLEEAAESFKEAIRLGPENANAHYNEGVALQYLNRPEEAAESFKEAIRLGPENAEIHCNYGLVLGKLGRLEEAVDSLKKAIRLDPENVDANKILVHVTSLLEKK
jgi:tetratricopeptide (TPR) repeat protein